MARPLTIGLTGGIAAGKSEALAAFERLGAATISADAIVHELFAADPLRERVIERWGEEVAPGGEVDRSAVGEIVFADPEELAWLESRIHPLVGERIAAWSSGLPEDTEVAVIEVPLLFETEMEGAFDLTVAVVAPEPHRQARSEARGHALVDERETRQFSQDEKAARADEVVRNDGSIAELEEALAELLDSLDHDASRD